MRVIDKPDLWAELENVIELSNGLIWDYFKESLGQAAFLLGVEDLKSNALRYEGLFVPPAGYETLLKTTKYAEEYFNKHGLEFVKRLTDTDKRMLRKLLEKHWGVGEDVFAREIKNEYLFSSERAKRIYRTETHMAHEAGAYMFARGGGAKYKMWLGNQQNACGICSRLHGEIQPVDKPFSFGTMYAPASWAMCVSDAIDARAPDLDTNAAVRFNSTTHKYEATPTYLLGSIGTSEDCALELGAHGSGNRNCYIDFHARDSPSDYTFRIIQTSNANDVLFYNSLNSRFVFVGKIGIGSGITPTYDLQLANDSAAKPSTNTWTVSSDRRLKEAITDADLDRCLEIVKALPLRHFKWKDEYIDKSQARDRSKLGWIADEVEPHFPKAVDVKPFHVLRIVKKKKVDPVTNSEIEVDEPESIEVFQDAKYLDADQIYAAMYGAVQKLITIVEDLQKEVEKLQKEVEKLKKKATSRA